MRYFNQIVTIHTTNSVHVTYFCTNLQLSKENEHVCFFSKNIEHN